MPEEGLEPSSLAAHDFESCTYTNSVTPALSPPAGGPCPPAGRQYGKSNRVSTLKQHFTYDILHAMEQKKYYNDSIFWVEVHRIKPNPFQPRKTFDGDGLRALAESIRQYGVLQPLVVTKKEIEKEGEGIFVEYELISGERRLRAAGIAGVSQVPVVIRTADESDKMKLELAIIENLQREDLNPVDRAKAFKQLVADFGMTHVQVAQKIGRSREYVSNTLRILALPEHMQEALVGGSISDGHTRPLLMLVDKPEEQETLFKEIIDKRMTVRESEKIARRIAVERARKHDLTPELMSLEKELTDTLGTRVRIEKRTQGGGKVMIDFFSDEDLSNLHAALTAVERQDDGIGVAEVEGKNVSFTGEIVSPVVEAVEAGKAAEEASPQVPNEQEHRTEDDLYSVRNFSI